MVASETSGPQFETTHWQILLKQFFTIQPLWKEENNEKKLPWIFFVSNMIEYVETFLRTGSDSTKIFFTINLFLLVFSTLILAVKSIIFKGPDPRVIISSTSKWENVKACHDGNNESAEFEISRVHSVWMSIEFIINFFLQNFRQLKHCVNQWIWWRRQTTVIINRIKNWRICSFG